MLTMSVSVRTLLCGAALLALGLPALPVVPAHAAAAALLRYHFVAGQQFRTVISSTSSMRLNGTASVGTQSQKIVQTNVTSSTFTRTVAVQSVAAEGTATIRITYAKASVTVNGTTQQPKLAKYALTLTVDPLGKVLRKKITGEAGLIKAVLDALPSGSPLEYPVAPIAVGGGWDVSDKGSLSSLGSAKAVIHYRLLALSGSGDRQTATVRGTIALPVRISQQGLQLAGRATGSQDRAFVVISGEPMRGGSALTFKGTLGGASSGATLKGTFSFTQSEVERSA